MASKEKSKDNHHVSYIDISIDETGVITMMNDGILVLTLKNILNIIYGFQK